MLNEFARENVYDLTGSGSGSSSGNRNKYPSSQRFQQLPSAQPSMGHHRHHIDIIHSSSTPQVRLYGSPPPLIHIHDGRGHDLPATCAEPTKSRHLDGQFVNRVTRDAGLGPIYADKGRNKENITINNDYYNLCRNNKENWLSMRPQNHQLPAAAAAAVAAPAPAPAPNGPPSATIATGLLPNRRNNRNRKCNLRPLQQNRLMDKNQTRTLHDLSCQFGTKGFTKEMRQIAGGSQSGLRKFLSQYPSLFTIDGEYVSITCYTNGGTNSNGRSNSTSGPGGANSGTGSPGQVPRGRDYTREAVDYFREKLEQYGAAEVPIKSLLGHRSQASLEVRHISGQHIREFRDFLARFPDAFVVRDDYVVLTKHWESICEGGSNEGGTLERREESPTPTHPPIDTQLTAQVLGFCRAVIESDSVGSSTTGKSPITSIDYLFAQLAAKVARGTWSCLIKNAQDLSTLLKMHSDTFTVHCGNVSLVPSKPSTMTTSTSSTRIAANSGSLVDRPMPISADEQLPTTATATTTSTSTLAPNSSSSNSSARPPMPSAMSFKQRLMSHLIKAVADNNAMEQRVYQTQSAPAAGHPAVSVQMTPSAGNNFLSGNSNALVPNFDVMLTSARLLKTTKVITKVQDCQAIVARIKALQPPVISFDAEGVNLGPSGPMTLLQLGTGDGQIYLFDLLACRELMNEGGLRDIFESTDVIKVVHDCRNDSAALFHQFGVALQNVFDTQAAHAVIQFQQTGKPVHKVKNVSLNTVCRMYGGPINPKKEQMKKLYRRDQRFWSRRPLTDDMVLYAAYDIWALVPIVYEAMREQMPGADANPLFRQLCAEQADAYVRVDQVKHSKKLRKIEAEVAELKRKMATTAGNRMVVLSNREIRLLRHVDLTDEERDKLEGSHKVARKLERLNNRGGNVNASGGDHSNADSSEASPEIDDDYDDEDEEEEEEDEEDEEEDFQVGKDREDIEESEDVDGGDADSTSPFYPFVSNNRGPNSSSPTLEDSIRLVEEFLANERFEALGIGNNDDNNRNGGGVNCANCSCNCHSMALTQRIVLPSPSIASDAGPNKLDVTPPSSYANKINAVDSSCQTLSTGDIVITKVYFEDKAANSPPKGSGAGSKATLNDATGSGKQVAI